MIKSIQVRVCRNSRDAMSDGEMRAGGKSNLDFLIISMKSDSGIEGHSLGFAGRGAEVAGQIAASALKPFFEGKDPLFREKFWQEFRIYDRWWNHVPIYSYGPFDICTLGHRGPGSGFAALQASRRLPGQGSDLCQLVCAGISGSLCETGAGGEGAGLAWVQTASARQSGSRPRSLSRLP